MRLIFLYSKKRYGQMDRAQLLDATQYEQLLRTQRLAHR